MSLGILVLLLPILVNSLKASMTFFNALEKTLTELNDMMYVYSFVSDELEGHTVTKTSFSSFSLTNESFPEIQYSLKEAKLRRFESPSYIRYLTHPGQVTLSCENTAEGRVQLDIRSTQYRWVWIR